MIRLSLVVVALAGGACTMFYEQPSTPIGMAAWKGDLPQLRSLVQQGANINEEDAVGTTPLYLAARGGHPIGPHSCGAEDEARPAVIAAMIELGANPNGRDRRPRVPGGSSGWTPLFVALHHDQFKSAAVMLEHGADPNIKSDQGMSAMEVAVAEGAPQQLMDLIKAKSEERSQK